MSHLITSHSVMPGPRTPVRSSAPGERSAPEERDTRRHRVLEAPLVTSPDEIPEGFQVAIFGLGCFWSAEEKFWQTPGVWSTAVGHTGGTTSDPTYADVSSGTTGHVEAVRVVFNPRLVSYSEVAKTFFTIHDPTQGARRGGDIGTQYRSAVFWTTPEQRHVAERLSATYGRVLESHGYGAVTTRIAPASDFYYAEELSPAVPCPAPRRVPLR